MIGRAQFAECLLPMREVTQAKGLQRYAAGLSISQIQREAGLFRPTIYQCMDKALAVWVCTGLKDRYHRPREPEILAGPRLG